MKRWKKCGVAMMTKEKVIYDILKRQISPSLRTDSPKPSDCEFAGVGLTTGIGCRLVLEDSGCVMTLRAGKKDYFKNTLPSSRHPSQTLMYKGLKPREGCSFSLPSPSLFQLGTPIYS